MLLVGAVLLASTIVTAALAAVLTSLLFPGGFLIGGGPPRPPTGLADTIPPALATTTPGRDPGTTGSTGPRAEPSGPSASALGWQASITCSVTVDDIGKAGKER